MTVKNKESTPINLNVELANLHFLRTSLAATKAKIDSALAEFREEHADLFTAESDTEALLKDCDAKIKAAAVEQFKANNDGNKQFIAGITIKEIKQPPVYDNDKAMAWAEKDAPMFILRTFDNKGFDGYLKTAATLPDFVTVPDPKPRADIASDLSKYVEVMEVAA